MWDLDAVALFSIFISSVSSLSSRLAGLQPLLEENRSFSSFSMFGDVAVWFDTGLCAAAAAASNSPDDKRRNDVEESVMPAVQ